MSHLSPETRALLERGREGEPLSEAHRRRLKRTVLVKATVASLLTATSPAAAWTSSAVKIVAVVSAIAVTGTAAVVGIQAVRARAPRVAAAAATRPVPPARLPTGSAPAATPAVPAIPPEPMAPVAAEPHGSSEAPSAAPARVREATAPALARTVARPRAEPTSLARPEPPAPSAAPVPAPSLSSDARLLRDAHDALASGDAEGALRLLDEHAARFPASVLEPERSAERVFALCHAGRIGDARAVAGDFLALHPGGPLSGRVRASCGGSAK